ncbi:MAG: alpha/beta fold hydrolase, partial [Pyrinomonadaceae bacterium]
MRTRVGRWSIHARVWEREAPAGAPTVVLVPGLGISGRYMIPTAVRLPHFARVYAIDLPGFGRSPKPPRALTVREHAGALCGWMSAMGLD